jgi:hypothetical protein
MDLFGEHNEIHKETKKDASMHFPSRDEQVVSIQQTPITPVEKIADKQKITMKDVVNLSAQYQRRKMLTRILVSVLSIIIVLVVMVVSGWLAVDRFVLNKKPAAIKNPVQLPVLVNQEPVVTPPVIPTQPIVNVPPAPLPDTPLAPLRGTLVKLQGSDVIYLIENNGELREVTIATVIFENGQKMSEISPTLIYTLPSRWTTIRRGQQVVAGQVDFDPRVLTQIELLPFIQ